MDVKSNYIVGYLNYYSKNNMLILNFTSNFINAPLLL